MIACIVLVLAFAGILLFTEPGLKLATTAVSHLSGNMVTVGSAEGRLLGKWRLSNVKIATESASVAVQSVACDWKPGRLLNKQVQLLEVVVDGAEVVLQDSGGAQQEAAQGSITLPEIAIPMGIVITKLLVNNAVLRQKGAEGELLLLKRLVLAMELQGDRLALQDLTFETPGYGASLAGELELAANWPIAAAGDFWIHQQPMVRTSGTLSLAGSVAAPEAEITILEPSAVRLQAKLEDVLSNPSWLITVSAQDVSPASFNGQWPGMNLELQLSSEGSLDHYRADLAAVIDGDAFQQVRTSLSIEGSTEHVRIEKGRISAGQGVVDISGEAGWDDAVRWRAQLAIDGLDPSVYEGAPAARIGGRITAAGEFNAGQLSYRLKFADLEATVVAPALKAKGLLELEGTEKGFSVPVANLEAGGGTLFLSGLCSWDQVLSWKVDARAESVDPSAFGELPAGKINGRLRSGGSMAGDDLAFTAEVVSLSGQLAGHEVGGGGNVEYRNSGWVIENFHLTDGRNDLNVDGSIEEDLELSFSLSASQLDALIPSLEGGLSARGSVTGTRDMPRLVASVSSDGISYDGFSTASIAADIDFMLEDEGKVDLAAALTGVDINGFLVQSIEVNVRGSTLKHGGTIRLDSNFGALRLDLAGSLDEAWQWRGDLSGISYDHPVYGRWLQKGDAHLEVSEELLKLAGLCVYSGENGLCASAEGTPSGAWSARIEELAFSLAKLNEWEFFDPPIRGAVQGAILAAGTGAVLSDLDGQLAVGELVLDVGDDEVFKELKLLDTRIESECTGGQLKLDVTSRSNDGGSVQGQVVVDNFGDLSGGMSDLPVSGNLGLEIRDLSPLAIVTGSYLVPSGRLSSSLGLSGKIGAPMVDGTVNLEKGALILPELGVILREVEAEINSDGQELAVELKALSGEGSLAADGSISISEGGWNGEFSLKGDKTELINQSELGIVASSDLLLKIGTDGGSLKGRVVIDQGRIEPEEMSGSDTESKDVVLMDEQKDEAEWPFFIDLEVGLGDQLHIDGYGLSGMLKGGLKVSMEEPGQLTGEGEVYLADSVISIFGRRLDISRGRIVFDGGPIDSPGLDVSATKTIEGESLGDKDVVVGINVNGVIYDYTVELFSVPPMEESRILAYLLLDKSSVSGEGESTIVSAAAGSIGLGGEDGLLGKVGGLLPVDEMRLTGSGAADDSSLVLGKKLTDELSIRYDYSLFKNIGYFKIRYNFGNGMAVESKSSTEANGIDLLYSFER